MRKALSWMVVVLVVLAGIDRPSGGTGPRLAGDHAAGARRCEMVRPARRRPRPRRGAAGQGALHGAVALGRRLVRGRTGSSRTTAATSRAGSSNWPRSPALAAGRRPATLAPVLAAIARYQKPDGHFGVDVDLSQAAGEGLPADPHALGQRPAAGRPGDGGAASYDDAEAAGRRPAAGRLLRRLGRPALLARPGGRLPRRAAPTATATPAATSRRSRAWRMLYRATRTTRYLKQAERMAEFFRKFDALPIDHSHGNLCAWRGILDALRDHRQARRTWTGPRAKWKAAMDGGYVWPIGGVGEHWYVSFDGDEGCSESDWLRLEPRSLAIHRRDALSRHGRAVAANQYLRQPVAQRRVRHAALRRRARRARRHARQRRRMALLLQLPRPARAPFPEGLSGGRLGPRRAGELPAELRLPRSRPPAGPGG